MRRLVSLLVLIAILIVVIGIWRHWFTIFVNRDQIRHDTHEIRKELREGEQKLKEGINQGAKPVEQKTNDSPAPSP